MVKGDKIEVAEATWLNQSCAYVIDGDIYVGSETGSNLILDPGVELRFAADQGIYVGYYSGTYGTLTAEGTSGAHIKFTSAAPEIARSAGDWDYVGFYDGAGTSSSLAYCDFEYGGGYSSNYGMIYVDGSGISITNSTVSHSGSMGINLSSDAMFTDCSDNTFGVNTDVPIEIYGNYVHTIENGNNFSDRGIRVKGDKMEQADVTWLKLNAPYLIAGDLYIGSETGAKLTIQEGAVLEFTEGSSFLVGYYSGTTGILKADGDAVNRIIFTSSAPAGSESAGDWDGIYFYDGTANGTILDNCTISYGGGYSNNSGNLSIVNDKAGIPEIINCRIENSAAWGIYLGNSASPTLTNNTFSNNALGNSNL